jgi:hypothetical protein
MVQPRKNGEILQRIKRRMVWETMMAEPFSEYLFFRSLSRATIHCLDTRDWGFGDKIPIEYLGELGHKILECADW